MQKEFQSMTGCIVWCVYGVYGYVKYVEFYSYLTFWTPCNVLVETAR